MRTLLRLVMDWLVRLLAPGRGTQKPRRPEQLTRPSPTQESAPRASEYAPRADGDADPGEVVWTWVAYEDDPSQGKDRPVLILARRGARLTGLALTSQPHDRADQLELGPGPWDPRGRTSYVKLDRVLEVDPRSVRREGAALDRARFDRVVAALERSRGRA